MGFERVVKKYQLVFTDGGMAGFECTVKGVSMERYLELVRMREDAGVAETMKLIEALADNMTAWNLEDDGAPIELTREAVLAEDSDFVMKIFLRWLEAVGSVEAPLPESSNGGELELEASIPMASLSPNRSS